MIRKIGIALILFYICYFPPILGFRSLRVLAVVSILYLVINLRIIPIYYKLGKLMSAYSICAGIAVWLAVIIMVCGQSLGALYAYVYWIIAVIPASLMVGMLVRKSGGNLDMLVDCILFAGLLQSAITLLSFISPSVKSMLLARLSAAGVLDLEYYGYYVGMRLYGYADGLTYATPVLQAFLAMLAFHCSIKKNIKYGLLIPPLLFSAIINARTSLVIVAVCGAIMLAQSKGFTARRLMRIIVMAFVSLVALVAGILVLQVLAPNTYLWIVDGASQILLFFGGDHDSGYFSYLIDANRWILPKGIELVFGAGTRIMGSNPTGYHSDVGYVNDIWLGGTIYCAVVYSLVFYYLRALKSSRASDVEMRGLLRYLVYAYLVCFIFLNLKGYIINLNGMANLLIVILVFQLVTVNVEERRKCAI